VVRRLAVAATLLLAIVGVRAQDADASFLQALADRYQPRTRAFQFALIGDQQYTADQENRFPALLRALDREPLAFVVHDGDIRGGSQPCSDDLFRSRLAAFQTSAHPFIFTPGDNDWTDCHRAALGGYDPLDRLAVLRTLFYGKATTSLGRKTLAVTSQSEHPAFALYRENQLWTLGRVVFATVHAVGSNNNLGRTPEADAEYRGRNAANLAWIRTAFALARRRGFDAVMLIAQVNPLFDRAATDPEVSGFVDMVRALEKETVAFGKPVVFVHGDTHYFRIDKPLPRRVVGNYTVPAHTNFTRVETFGPADVSWWVRGRVVPGSADVFQFAPVSTPQ
jgi:hypothetical protein